MAYKIRYGPEKTQRRETLGLRTAVSLGILTGTVLMGLFWPSGREVLEQVFRSAPASVLENATAECAAAVEAGKGWVYGLAAFASGMCS